MSLSVLGLHAGIKENIMTPEELREICNRVGSQAEVARLTDLSRYHINKLVNGKYNITPSTATLIKLATKSYVRDDDKNIDAP